MPPGGNPSSWPPPALAAWNYYRWNGAWGYLRFDALNLYYAHGRWYNPDTGLFLSPDANGSYKYDERQNAVNYAQGDPCENRKPPVTPPVGGMIMDWIPADGFPEGEITTIHRLKPDILACARRHNTVKTNMDENAFAALMTAIIHWEGRLPGNAKPFWGLRGVGDISGGQIRDILGDLAGRFFGADVTTGIANIRPSVAFEILKGEIPGFQGRYCYNIEGGTTYDDIRNDPFRGLTLFNELQKEKVSLEYLAANLERGADRINTLGFQASVFNLAAWHHRGVQTRLEFQRSPSAQSYGNVILSTMPTALRILSVQGRYLPYNLEEAEFVDAHLRRPR